MKLINAAFMLSNVKRFSGKCLNNEYSVGEHCFRVALLAMMILDDYNQRNTKNKISMEETLKKALLHDIEESIVGDIPSPVKKYGNLKEELRNASEEILKNEIISDSYFFDQYLKLWKEDKSGPSGEIIILADSLEVLIVSCREINRGNNNFKDILEKTKQIFESAKYKELFLKYPYAKEIYEKTVNNELSECLAA